jgi:ABC-type uncharacterized transport system permease subunit
VNRHIGETLAILAIALAIPSLFVLFAGKNPVATWATLVSYTLGTWHGFSEVLVNATPLTLLGLGIVVAFRAGIFNIGGDGQLICGAVMAVAMAGFAAPLGPLGLPVFLLLGFAGGAAIGALVGWLRARFGANEIIVTIMLNYVALQVLTWVIRGPLQEPMRIFPRSYRIADNLFLPALVDGARLHAGLFVALAATVAVYLLVRHTVFGFRLDVLGRNAQAAPFAGIRAGRVAVLAMLVSGGLAGLAGAVEIAGLHQKLEDNFAAGYGLAAIAVALMARLNPAFVPLAALLFGVFEVGAGVLQRQLAIPFPLVWIIQGTVILAYLALDWSARRRQAVAA